MVFELVTTLCRRTDKLADFSGTVKAAEAILYLEKEVDMLYITVFTPMSRSYSWKTYEEPPLPLNRPLCLSAHLQLQAVKLV